MSVLYDPRWKLRPTPTQRHTIRRNTPSLKPGLRSEDVGASSYIPLVDDSGRRPSRWKNRRITTRRSEKQHCGVLASKFDFSATLERDIEPQRDSHGISSLGNNSKTPDEAWDIYIRTLCGRTFVIVVHPHDTIESVRVKIRMKEGFLEDHQVLLYRGVRLSEGPLRNWKINDSSTLFLTVRLRGG